MVHQFRRAAKNQRASFLRHEIAADSRRADDIAAREQLRARRLRVNDVRDMRFVTSFLLATELDNAASGSCEGIDQPAPR